MNIATSFAFIIFVVVLSWNKFSLKLNSKSMIWSGGEENYPASEVRGGWEEAPHQEVRVAAWEELSSWGQGVWEGTPQKSESQGAARKHLTLEAKRPVTLRSHLSLRPGRRPGGASQGHGHQKHREPRRDHSQYEGQEEVTVRRYHLSKIRSSSC